MDVFHSKYKVLNKLGEGSFSEVLKVENRETGICYAAKRLKKLYKTLRPLFPGSNEIDQLSKIHQIVGSPSIQFLSRLKSRSRNCIFFPKLKGTGVDILLPFITRSGRNILRLMIEYDPDKRINVKRLLRNCYFDDIRVTYEINMERYRPQARSQIWYRPNESLKRSMGDDGSICSNRCLVRNKILKREHYPDEIRSNKESRKKVFEDPNFLILPTEIPYYALKKPLQSNKSNLNYKTCSLPAVDQKILKTLSEDCKPKTDVKNRLVKNGSLKKKREQRFFKTTSNLETVKHDMDVKSLQKNTLQSKSFILPRRLGQHKIDTIKDKNVAVFQAKKNGPESVPERRVGTI
ncbi:hypothetical protein NQ318_017386 [Aromia moschata]|uniref:Protein kinase domain-containing protein n=1 Tax=Aromia moschata TaxID=1265417 RepID=A0AAV8Z2H3_9CUCU|nr:hypothetical protein NQ318_017386 [Aromia moschata]